MKSFQAIYVGSQNTKPGFADNIVEGTLSFRASDALDATTKAVEILTDNPEFGDAAWDGITLTVLEV